MKSFLAVIFLVIIFIIPVYVFSDIYYIGKDRIYKSPNELTNANVLSSGDTIVIDEGEYRGQDALAVWSPNRLHIIGLGNQAHMIADGKYVQGKGTWVLKGDNISINNIRFSGAKVPDKNGAGIRLDGVGLIVQHCYFHDNENGILTSNPYDGDIIIEHTEFANNGFGDGYSHNLYVGHVNKLIFRFNYSHHANFGHNLKSRANENYILYNRIMDEGSGNSSRLIDIPNGGYSVVMGNLLMQGANAVNGNIIGYGLEGLTNERNEFYVINNTFVNKRQASCIFVSCQEGTKVCDLQKNIFAGSGLMLNGEATNLKNNYKEQNIAKLFFKDEINYDYKLTSRSPVIDLGRVSEQMIPEFEYEHPLNSLPRTIVGNIDVGAHEYPYVVGVASESLNELSLFPNPASDIISIRTDFDIESIDVYNYLGQLVSADFDRNSIKIDHLPCGIYTLYIKTLNGIVIAKKFIKE